MRDTIGSRIYSGTSDIQRNLPLQAGALIRGACVNHEIRQEIRTGAPAPSPARSCGNRYTDAVAVVDGDRTMTYRELDKQANQLSHLLVTMGVTRGDRVALYLDKSLEAIVGVYAILKAGGAYVPIDPMAPTDRCAYVVQDCRVRCLVSATSKQVPANEIIARAACPRSSSSRASRGAATARRRTCRKPTAR